MKEKTRYTRDRNGRIVERVVEREEDDPLKRLRETTDPTDALKRLREATEPRRRRY